MILKSRRIFVPCGISSFFEICDRGEDGNAQTDPLLIGARGGGFKISNGSVTTAEILGSMIEDEVYINGARSEAVTTHKVLHLMREKGLLEESVRVRHTILSPIGCGYGTSGAGAIGTALAVSDALGKPLTLNAAGQIAHIAEILCLTGLGTVIALSSDSSGVGLVLEPGAPGIGKIYSILDDYDQYRIVCITFGPVEKAGIISSEYHRLKINRSGHKVLKKVLKEPTPENLLKQARIFAEESGLGRRELLDLADELVRHGAVGATQNMIGNAVHALVRKDRVVSLNRYIRAKVSAHNLLISEIYSDGPKIV